MDWWQFRYLGRARRLLRSLQIPTGGGCRWIPFRGAVSSPAAERGARGVTRLQAGALPRNWRRYPAPRTLVDLGTRWADDTTTAILVVPSAVIPGESNYLLNPRHSDFTKIRVGQPEPFSFDPRMGKR
jgi:RES domain